MHKHNEDDSMKLIAATIKQTIHSHTTNNHAIYNDTVGFHNFKSRNFKLSVSNPKNKYDVYVSVLSQISNCQSLGRNNKHKMLKTDRNNDNNNDNTNDTNDNNIDISRLAVRW